jgi:hypothetical protein
MNGWACRRDRSAGALLAVRPADWRQRGALCAAVDVGHLAHLLAHRLDTGSGAGRAALCAVQVRLEAE